LKVEDDVNKRRRDVFRRIGRENLKNEEEHFTEEE
jgi:hypothetical protein